MRQSRSATARFLFILNSTVVPGLDMLTKSIKEIRHGMSIHDRQRKDVLACIDPLLTTTAESIPFSRAAFSYRILGRPHREAVGECEAMVVRPRPGFPETAGIPSLERGNRTLHPVQKEPTWSRIIVGRRRGLGPRGVGRR
jgi:hypothetical protein